mmetsp:Transcript_14610/g.24063  ORF Transcript_14610/g.24063 Transcript_14610/m.24063 type:complete len:206 (-) Transcript_14610:285-902(-)
MTVEITVMVASARKAPQKTMNWLWRTLMSAAMKNVRSPISMKTMTRKDWTNPAPNVVLSENQSAVPPSPPLLLGADFPVRTPSYFSSRPSAPSRRVSCLAMVTSSTAIAPCSSLTLSSTIASALRCAWISLSRFSSFLVSAATRSSAACAPTGTPSASPVAAAETLASEVSVSEMSDGAASASAARPFGLKSARTVRACFFRTSK